VNSNAGSDGPDFDLARDVPTTPEDVDTLWRLGRATASWLSLTPAEIEALIPDGALDRRPPMRADAKPFTLV
jgi:hypothetical protein